MPSPSQILSDPNYVNANSATKKAIFDKLIAVDPSFVNANAETKTAIRQRFGSLAFDNPTSVSATPTGPMAAIRQFAVDVAGNTAERARPYLEAFQTKPTLANALELYNPLNRASDIGKAFGIISAPLAGAGDTLGTRIDPVFGKPGSGGGEERKYGDVLQLATPLPGGAMVKGGKAAIKAVDLAGALAAARKAPGAVRGVMAAPFKAGGRAIAAPVSRFMDAGSAAARQEALVAGEVPRQQTLDLLRKQKQISGIESYKAGEKTRQNLIEAETSQTQLADVLNQQITAKAEAEATRASAEAAIAEAGKTKPFAPGASVTAGEQGGILRQAVTTKRAETLKPFEDIDAKLRPQVEADRAAREAAGESVADIKEGKDLLKASKNSMSPSPATRPTVSSIPRSDTGGRMHEMIIDALENNTVKLSKAEADIAKAAGYDVKEIPTALENGLPGETIYLRTFKTSSEALDNLGRYFGEQAFGKGEASGFPAVSKKLIGDKYFEIQNALNKFTPSRIPLQANYEAKLAADAPFRGTAVGKGSLETVKKTDIPKVTEEALATRAFTSRQGYADAKVQAGPETAKTLLVERLKNEFRDSATGGQKSFDAVQKILDANQGRIRGIIKDEPEVEKLVNNHLQQLKDAELNAIDAKEMIGLKATKFDTLSENLGIQSKTIREQITSAEKAAEESIKAKENALKLQRIFGTEISALKSVDENKIIGEVKRLTESMRKENDIDIATHEKIIASTKEYKIALDKADTADKRAKLRQAYVKRIPYLVGAGAATSAGFGAFNILKGE